jgi:hypothetical protein
MNTIEELWHGHSVEVIRDSEGYKVHFGAPHQCARIVPYGSPSVPAPRLTGRVWVLGDGERFSASLVEMPEGRSNLTRKDYEDRAIEAVKEYIPKWEWLFAFNVDCSPELDGTWKVTFNPKSLMAVRGWNGTPPRVPRAAQVIVGTKPKLAVLEYRPPETRFEDKVQADYEAAALARIADRAELEEMMQAAR